MRHAGTGVGYETVSAVLCQAACVFEFGKPCRTLQMADNTFTLKICVVGPCRSGKTLLCRALAEQPIIQGDYSATAAVRIQEFSRQIGVDRVKVQLWDCSGSMQYQSYWSVLAKVRALPLQRSCANASSGYHSYGPMQHVAGPDLVWPRTCLSSTARISARICAGRTSLPLCPSPPLQDIDGVLMVIDPSQPDQERDLEQLYMNFAQPNSLTIKQCLILAIQVAREGSFGLGGWQGEREEDRRTDCYIQTVCGMDYTLTTYCVLCVGMQGKLNKLTSAFVSLNPSSIQSGVQVIHSAAFLLLEEESQQTFCSHCYV